MWTKLITASVIEAIGHKDEPAVAAPPTEAVTAFRRMRKRQGERAAAQCRGAAQTREADNAYLFETAGRRRQASPVSWVHRNYLAK